MNLQNLPSGSTYGKLIKSMFISFPGWIFGGADFASLEDYISALLTKDPNKLAVYEKGFDGHSLRAAYYFKDELSQRNIQIDISNPVSVNSIAELAKDLRQDSKAPTFALTYFGTYATLMTNLGWSEVKAKAVEVNYHNLYQVSDQYAESRFEQCAKDGYATVAFGLRVRTPLMAQVVWGSSGVPNAAKAESRSVGNAFGQSYGMLNNRAAVEFFEKVWNSPYANKILPINLIHDCIYIMMVDDIDVVTWANDELTKSMAWQELPEIKHDTVKIHANLDLFYPDWAHPITLKIGSSKEEIIETVKKSKEKV